MHSGTEAARVTGTVTAARAALDALVGAGVDVVFGNPGTTELPLIKELAREERLRYSLLLHEGAAMAAAAGHALATGRPGVALVHAMPGVGNAMSMHFNAWRSRVPVVLVAGTQDRRQQYLDPILQADLDDIARPISKRVWEVRTAMEIPEVLTRALREALAPPRGPVLVSVPVDLWNEPVAVRRHAPVEPPVLGAAPAEAVEALAGLLLSADQPVLVTGDLVGVHRCGDLVAALAELVGARAHWAPSTSLASIPTTSGCHHGPIFPDTASYARAFAGADLVVAVGAELPPTILFEGVDVVPAGARTASVGELPGDALGLLRPELSLHGDLTATLQRLFDAVRARLGADVTLATAVAERSAQVVARGRESRAKLRRRGEAPPEQEAPLAPAVAVATALGAAPEDVIVVDEGVSNAGWITLLGEFRDAVSYVAMPRGGSLGYALGAAIGANVGSGRPVLVIVGDGALMYGPQGLWTMASEGLPIVTCVLNNAGYEILRGFMRSEHFSPPAGEGAVEPEAGGSRTLEISGPTIDVAGLARASGVPAERVTSVGQLSEAVRGAFASGGPLLVDVPVIGSGTPA